MNEVVKASKEIKGKTSRMRKHLDELERARNIYMATIEKAETAYFERITEAMREFLPDLEETVESQSQPASPGLA